MQGRLSWNVEDFRSNYPMQSTFFADENWDAGVLVMLQEKLRRLSRTSWRRTRYLENVGDQAIVNGDRSRDQLLVRSGGETVDIQQTPREIQFTGRWRRLETHR